MYIAIMLWLYPCVYITVQNYILCKFVFLSFLNAFIHTFVHCFLLVCVDMLSGEGLCYKLSICLLNPFA